MKELKIKISRDMLDSMREIHGLDGVDTVVHSVIPQMTAALDSAGSNETVRVEITFERCTDV